MVIKIGNASLASPLPRQPWMGKIGRNLNGLGHGPVSRHLRRWKRSIRAEIERLDGEFDLVRLTDRMEESLVLLRHLLRWSTEDVVHLDLNWKKSKKSEKLSWNERQVLAKLVSRRRSNLSAFERRFDERVSQFNYMKGFIRYSATNPWKNNLTCYKMQITKCTTAVYTPSRSW